MIKNITKKIIVNKITINVIEKYNIIDFGYIFLISPPQKELFQDVLHLLSIKSSIS